MCCRADDVDLFGQERDIIFGVMWAVEVESEVERWLDSLLPKEFAAAQAHIKRLAQEGSQLRPPATRSLGDGLFELRFNLKSVAWRVTFRFAPGHRIVLLAVFRKQRRREQHELKRAAREMRRSIQSDSEEST